MQKYARFVFEELKLFDFFEVLYVLSLGTIWTDRW